MKEILELFGDWLDSFGAIILKGSRNRPETTDYWSDTDLLIFLKEKPSLSRVEEYLSPLMPWEGRDVYDDPFSVTVRLTTTRKGGVTSWDITFAGSGFELEKVLSRGDNLIGLHLILGLLREYLVFDMMERDKRMGTNIHRFGGQESLSESLIPRELGKDSPEKTLEYLENLASAVDEKLKNNIPSYRSRFSAFQKHLTRSREKARLNLTDSPLGTILTKHEI